MSAYGPELAHKAAAITPNDTTDLPGGATLGIYVGGGGDVELILENDSASVVYKGVPTGTILPVCARRVKAAQTNATYLVALY